MQKLGSTSPGTDSVCFFKGRRRFRVEGGLRLPGAALSWVFWGVGGVLGCRRALLIDWEDRRPGTVQLSSPARTTTCCAGLRGLMSRYGGSGVRGLLNCEECSEGFGA